MSTERRLTNTPVSPASKRPLRSQMEPDRISTKDTKQQQGFFLYLKKNKSIPVRGGSVNVRTKRREKRTKLPLSAFGNIYPPFIVTPLFRNFSKIVAKQLQTPPSPILSNTSHGSGPCFSSFFCYRPLNLTTPGKINNEKEGERKICRIKSVSPFNDDAASSVAALLASLANRLLR